MGSIHFLLWVALVLAVAAGIFDLRTGHIPNWLTLGGLAGAFVLQVITGAAHRGLHGAGAGAITALLGTAACALVPVVLYRLAGMGGGDVKLLAALGALCGPSIGLQAQFYSFIAVLLYAPLRMTYEGKLWRTLRNALLLAINPVLPKEKRKSVPAELMTSLRFGPAVAAGVLATILAHWRAV